MMTAFKTIARLRLAALLLLASICSCAAQGSDTSAVAPHAKPTTIFLVRHAERGDAPAGDPALNEAGNLRAEALARMLSASRVKAIYTSQFLRTRQTAEPLARKLGIPAEPVPLSVKPSNPREVSDESLRALLARVNEHAGETVLIVGHSNSIPEVIRILGGDMIPKIEESSFDDLFVVTLHAPGRATVVHLKYGG